MKALVKTEKGRGCLELLDVPVPVPGPGEVLLKILAAGVCGTDLHVRDDQFPYWPPVTLGHEFCGRVEKLGPGVSLVALGDRVVGEPHTRACGHCYLCRTGNIQICSAKRSPGWGIDGAMAEYLVMPERLLHKVPDSMSDEVAAVIEPAANVVHDVLERATVSAGDLVVVIGPGPIGLLAAMAARAAGAREVVITGRNVDEPLRLAKARQLGFTHSISSEQRDPAEVVQELSNGRGADLIVECSGSAGGIAQGVQLARKKARFCAIGLTGKDTIAFPYRDASFKVLDMYFCLSTSYTCWDKAIHLAAAGKMDLASIITHREPLANWASVFKAMDEQLALKAVLIP